ncbi:MAG: hypothetical protein WHU54_03910 [Candidatus Bathyarchaeia archaeon]
MKKKKALVTVELIDESVMVSNSTIAEEIFAWLVAEVVPAPWVKEVKGVIILS